MHKSHNLSGKLSFIAQQHEKFSLFHVVATIMPPPLPIVQKMVFHISEPLLEHVRNGGYPPHLYLYNKQQEHQEMSYRELI